MLPHLFKAPTPPSGADTTAIVLIVVAFLLLIVVGFAIFIWRRKAIRPSIGPQEPIFPRYEKKDTSISMLWEQQVKVRMGGLIEAGIQMEKIDTESGKFVIYTSTEPIKEFALFLGLGKPVHIAAWINTHNDANKELVRIHCQIQKQSKKDIVTGNVHEKVVLEFTQFEVKDDTSKNKTTAVDIILDNVEKWSNQFAIEQITGSIRRDLWTDDFSKRGYQQIDAQVDKSVKFIKKYSRNKKS